MNLRIELKYAVLITLLMLLWLSAEFMVGLHEGDLIAYHPYVTILAVFIPIVCTVLAIREKRELYNGSISFQQALVSGLVITGICTLTAPIVQWVFSNLINPDFFTNMIDYAVARAKLYNADSAQSRELAEQYFNAKSYTIQSVIGTAFIGTLTSVAVAIVNRSKK